MTFTESTTIQGGPGLFIGLRYQLTRRLSRITESTLSLIAGSRDRIVMENGTTVKIAAGRVRKGSIGGHSCKP